MQSDAADNPFAAPQTSGVSIDRVERDVRTVIRVFQWVGWPLAVLFGIGFVGVVVMTASLTVLGDLTADDATEVALITSFYCVAFLLSYCCLHTAERMKRRDPSARTLATIFCCAMMLGFPLFTLIGLLCLSKLRSYPAYCDAGEEAA